ncbi:MAG: GntR family transcriptional regulator [Sphaerochaetaceae bacterium]|nr:GntR family transcriptional regulator [Bacteroidales bacterium]
MGKKKDTSLQTYAYTYLKTKILNCEILPGACIDEKKILEKLDVGKTPFREALLLLQSEHLVEAKPRHGLFVSKLTTQDVREVFSIRKMIEPIVTIEYLDRIDLSALMENDTHLKQLTEQSQEKDMFALCRTDMDFHTFFIKNSGNSRLIRLLTSIFQDAYRISMYNAVLSGTYDQTWKETYVQHHQILQAILREDKKEIINTYTMHLNYYMVSILRNLAALKK